MYIRKGIMSVAMVLLLIPSFTWAETDPFVPTPEDLLATQISATRVVLNWQLPEAASDDIQIDHYEIQLLKDSQTIKNIKSKKLKKIARGLEPNTTYRFSVRSVGVNKNKSSWSDYGEFTTTEPMRFVKLVDTADETLDTEYPGSDIDAVEITRTDGTGYALKVIASNILSGNVGNSHSDPAQALAAPDFFEATDTGYVSMGGPDAYLILRLELGINDKAEKLKIYEIGSGQGGVDEFVEVYVGETATGPWVYLGEGTGEFNIKL